MGCTFWPCYDLVSIGKPCPGHLSTTNEEKKTESCLFAAYCAFWCQPCRLWPFDLRIQSRD